MRKFIQLGWRGNLLAGELSGTLDHARWLAALAVCVAHLRNILFPDAAEVANMAPLVKIFYFITLFGTQSVVIFFVISGLLVGGSVLRRLKGGRFDLAEYAIDRFTRLYIVLIPAIALSVALDYMNLAQSCSHHASAGNIILNLIFLQNIVAEPLCNNHPLWSLANEAIYYAAFAALVLAIFRKSFSATISLFLIVAVASWGTFAFNPSPRSVGFGAALWLIGLAPWFITIRARAPIGLALTAIALVASRTHLVSNEYAANLLIASCFALALSQQIPGKISEKSHLAGKSLSAFSYSLYLIHMPISQAAGNIIGRKLEPGTLGSYVIFLSVLILILLIAWIFGQVFEKNTPLARAHISSIASKLHKRRQPPARGGGGTAEHLEATGE